MAKNGEYTFKEAAVLYEKTVGEITVKLIAEYDSAAEDPASTLRYRSGRVFSARGGTEMLNNGITFTAGNVDAFLEAYPEIIEVVREHRASLPKPKAQNGEPVRTKAADPVASSIAALFTRKKEELPVAPKVPASASKKRPF